MTSLNCYNNKITSRELEIVITNHGIITDITTNCYDILGYTNDEMINTNISKLFKINIKNLISNKDLNVEFTRKDGLTQYFSVQATPFTTDNKVEAFYLSIIDISKYKELEKRDNLILRMLEHAKDIICRWELLPEPRFTYLNSSVEDFFGYPIEDYIKNPMLPFEIAHPDDQEIQFSKIKSDTDFSKLFQVRLKHKDGYYIWVEDYIIPYFNEYNQLVAVESITRNIQVKKELEQRLEKIGYNDTLTELYNKNYFLKEVDLLNNVISIPVGIFVCDLDSLKYTNDSFGHSSGDILIRNTAKVLKSVFTDEHVISRTGGDEFVIIVKNKSYSEVKKLYADLQIAIKVFNEKNKNIPIKISIGIAYSENSISKMQSTLDTADSNMYNNKKHKKL